jgi:ATP-dependent DNA helicase RecG
VSAAAANLGIETVGDLIEHVPAGHEFRAGVPVAELRPGAEATIEVEVISAQVRPTRRRNFRIVEAKVFDDSGAARAVWFNQTWLAQKLEPGLRLRLFGTYRKGVFQVREHRFLGRFERESAASLEQTDDFPGDAQGGGIVSIYPGTEGLKSQRLRELVEDCRGAELDVVDPLPGRLLASERLLGRASALAAMHFPRDADESEAGRRRLAFEELLLQQIALRMRRRNRASGLPAIALKGEGDVLDRWYARLPFELTAGQQAAIAKIRGDVSGEDPMQRLLMGEVGSGKTVVALAAMLMAAQSGAQSALMAPTETLAEQHFANLDRMLPEVPLALLTGSTPARRRRDVLARLASGELALVVGTHALIEPAVQFRRLALVVVDEQHRFGVRQRAALDAKSPAGRAPHVLHMTATPIPRTLALVQYGDIETTAIRELPKGRQPVITKVLPESQRGQAVDAARERLAQGRQVFVVCPLVEESEQMQARAATVEAQRIARDEFPDHRVGLIHGQMSSAEKSNAMDEFASGRTDVLVATSVIEVGIDVPNAAVMIVESAERYGISQLHQLRGRIGRGEHNGECYLIGPPASPRLRAVAHESDGFKLAEVDLALREGGEVLGTRQHGLPRFRVASLPADNLLLERARLVCDQLLADDPELSSPELDLLRVAVAARYGNEASPIPG